MTGMQQYRELRKWACDQAAKLESAHRKHLKCRAGCTHCCVNLTVFPVEFYAILEDLKAAEVGKVALDEEASCAFLRDGLCSIYTIRPIICLTYGIPIVFLNLDLEPHEMNVTFCHLNFEDAEGEDLDFGPENTLNLDDLNTRLAEANVQFLADHPELKLAAGQRLALRDLTRHLSAGDAMRVSDRA